MSQGHRWAGSAGQTQNQGNVLGDRPCVRQSANYRQHLGGNAVKEAMGQSNLCWKINEQEGAYAGMKTFDHNNRPAAGQQNQNQQQQQQQQQQVQNQQTQQNQQQFGGHQQQHQQAAQFQQQNQNHQGFQAQQTQQLQQQHFQQAPPPPPQHHHQHQEQQHQNHHHHHTPHNQQPQQGQQMSQKELIGVGTRRGAGQANRQTYNVLTGQ